MSRIYGDCLLDTARNCVSVTCTDVRGGVGGEEMATGNPTAEQGLCY